MKWALRFLLVILLAVQIVWILQTIHILPESTISQVVEYSVIGIILIATIVIWVSSERRRKP